MGSARRSFRTSNSGQGSIAVAGSIPGANGHRPLDMPVAIEGARSMYQRTVWTRHYNSDWLPCTVKSCCWIAGSGIGSTALQIPRGRVGFNEVHPQLTAHGVQAG